MQCLAWPLSSGPIVAARNLQNNTSPRGYALLGNNVRRNHMYQFLAVLCRSADQTSHHGRRSPRTILGTYIRPGPPGPVVSGRYARPASRHANLSLKHLRLIEKGINLPCSELYHPLIAEQLHPHLLPLSPESSTMSSSSKPIAVGLMGTVSPQTGLA